MPWPCCPFRPAVSPACCTSCATADPSTRTSATAPGSRAVLGRVHDRLPILDEPIGDTLVGCLTAGQQAGGVCQAGLGCRGVEVAEEDVGRVFALGAGVDDVVLSPTREAPAWSPLGILFTVKASGFCWKTPLLSASDTDHGPLMMHATLPARKRAAAGSCRVGSARGNGRPAGDQVKGGLVARHRRSLIDQHSSRPRVDHLATLREDVGHREVPCGARTGTWRQRPSLSPRRASYPPGPGDGHRPSSAATVAQQRGSVGYPEASPELLP